MVVKSSRTAQAPPRSDAEQFQKALIVTVTLDPEVTEMAPPEPEAL
jgi:hypothetical protein